MEMNILEEKENKFFKRKDLKIELKHSGAATPKKVDLVKELAAKYSVPEEHVVVDYIFSKTGANESVARVKIYQEKPVIKVKQAKPKEEKKSEAQAGQTK